MISAPLAGGLFVLPASPRHSPNQQLPRASLHRRILLVGSGDVVRGIRTCVRFSSRGRDQVRVRWDHPRSSHLRAQLPADEGSPKNAEPRQPSNTLHGEEPSAPATPPAPPAPTARDALNWFCISIIVLIVLVDFSPLGGPLPGAPGTYGTPWAVALVQWGLFVAPTVTWARDCGFPLRATFKLSPCSAPALVSAAFGGAACWAVVSTLVAVKGGAPPHPASPPPAWGGLFWFALSPAVAEELLFRGFVLSALGSSFGRVDAVMLAAAMFAAFHLSLPQVFPTAALGIAAGFAAQASGSVFPAMALHFGHNAAALIVGALEVS